MYESDDLFRTFLSANRSTKVVKFDFYDRIRRLAFFSPAAKDVRILSIFRYLYRKECKRL